MVDFIKRLIDDYKKEGKLFELVLLIPVDPVFSGTEYSLIVSAKWLDKMSPKKAIEDITNRIEKESLNKIARVTPIHTEDKFVKDFVDEFEVNYDNPLRITDYISNGYLIEKGIIAQSGSTATHINKALARKGKIEKLGFDDY